MPTNPVPTSVAPRDRPVTTSLAPRQRPKGNNQIVEGQDDSVAAFKKQSGNTRPGSNLRRSHSLKDMSTNTQTETSLSAQKANLRQQVSPVQQTIDQLVVSMDQQLQNQIPQNQIQQNQIPQNMQEQKMNKEQHDYYIRQQQQLQYYQHCHQQQQLHQQQQIKQQQLQQQQQQQQQYQQQQQQQYQQQLQQQQHQEYLKQQREILMRQQEQEMLMRQQKQQLQQQKQQQQQQIQQQQQKQQIQQQQQKQQLQQQQQQKQQLQQQQQQQLQKQQQQQQLYLEKQKKEEYLRQRQEQYARLHQLKEEEERSRQKIEQHRQRVKQQQELSEKESFNPRLEDARLCRSVEPSYPSSIDRVASSPFEDDFTRSSPDLSNPFLNQDPSDCLNPFQVKKKTHNRSRSDTFTRVAIRPKDATSSELRSTAEESNNKSSLGDVSLSLHKPLKVDVSNAVSGKPNPFVEQEINKEVDNKEDNTDNKLNTNTEASVETGILLEIDDDAHFVRLQQELNELGILDKGFDKGASKMVASKDKPVNTANLDPNRSSNHDDASPLISPSISPPSDVKAYIYRRTASCSSSSEHSSSEESAAHENESENTYHHHAMDIVTNLDDDNGDIDKVYDDIMKETTSINIKKQINVPKKSPKHNDDGNDIFASAPFKITNKNNANTKPTEVKGALPHKHEKQSSSKTNEKTNKLSSHSNVSHEFKSNFSSQGFVKKEDSSSDPFGMAPMNVRKTSKGSSVGSVEADPFSIASVSLPSDDPFKVPTSKQRPASEDPFGSAPFSKTFNKSAKNVPTSDIKINKKVNRRKLPSAPPQYGASTTVSSQSQ